MNISVNGRDRDVAPRTSVADVVRDTANAPRGIAVALNGEVVPRDSWPRPLRDGDRVEILTASQGG